MSLCAGPAPSEARIDEIGRQAFRGRDTAIAECPEADASRVVHAFVERGERLPLVEIRGVHRVPGGARRQASKPGCLSLRVVEEQDLRHGGAVY